ncbi:MAG: ABC transporter ATP-binding protein [Sulfolobales archaeon]
MRDLSLSIERGSITAVLGPNGAGKTTLARTISGLIKPVKGFILFEGLDIAKLEPHKIVELGVIHVPEGRRLFPYMTVYENLLLGAYSKRAREKFRDNLERVFNIFPILRERLRQKAGTLSGGEQQMLAIARTLIAEPRLLILDEPSQGLAPKIIEQIFSKIKELRDQENITVMLIEQNAVKALEISDYAYIIEMGSVVKEGDSAKLSQDQEIRRVYLGI